MKTINLIIDRITDMFAYIAGFFLVYIVISVTLDVIFRYLFNNPLPYTLDISEILLLFITFLTAAWVMKRGGHVKMDFLLASMSKKHQAFMYGISTVFSALICLVFCWYGFAVTIDLFQRKIIHGLMLELPRAPLIAVIPISFLFLFFQCIKKSIEYFQEWNKLRIPN